MTEASKDDHRQSKRCHKFLLSSEIEKLKKSQEICTRLLLARRISGEKEEGKTNVSGV